MAPTRIEINQILCPIDFSDFSYGALERAVRLASEFGARVEALHVIPYVMTSGLDFPYFPAPKEATPAAREEAGRQLERFVAPFREQGVTIETRLREGDPWRDIQAEAEALPADLVVMGTHGRSGFEHMLLGSVTEKVLRRAPCPVLIVGKVKAASPGGPLFQRILCATDLSKASGRTIDFALSLAEENQAELTLLNVIESLPSETSGAKLYLAVPEIGPLRRELTEQSKERLHQAVPDEARQWCEVKELVKVGAAWRAVLRAAEETNADLIVMGERAHGPIGRIFFGSTTSQVVSHSPCPVLVVRKTKAREPLRPEGEAEAAVTVAGGADRSKGKGEES